ncbi:hypothetical protein BH23ACT5_BH23ACT5_16230 [soil metagenome]
MAAILVYALIGLAVGAVTRFIRAADSSSLVGMLGTGGAGGVGGGVLANLVFGEQVRLDWFGLAGSFILALVAVMVVRSADRTSALEPPPPDV